VHVIEPGPPSHEHVTFFLLVVPDLLIGLSHRDSPVAGLNKYGLPVVDDVFSSHLLGYAAEPEVGGPETEVGLTIAELGAGGPEVGLGLTIAEIGAGFAIVEPEGPGAEGPGAAGPTGVPFCPGKALGKAGSISGPSLPALGCVIPRTLGLCPVIIYYILLFFTKSSNHLN
jgi:hypothetical protein